MIETFLTYPIGIRFSIVMLIALFLWFIIGKLILKAVSLVPILIKYILYVFYLIIEIPFSALHQRFGGGFGKADQQLADLFRNITSVFDKICSALQNPKSFYRISFFVVLAFSVYLIIPQQLDWQSNAFVFWHDAYTQCETQMVNWMTAQDWMNQLIVYQ